MFSSRSDLPGTSSLDLSPPDLLSPSQLAQSTERIVIVIPLVFRSKSRTTLFAYRVAWRAPFDDVPPGMASGAGSGVIVLSAMLLQSPRQSALLLG